MRGSAILPSVAAIFVCAILTLSDAFPMFGRRGTLKSCSFEVPIGSDGMLPDAFPMSYVEAGGCWKEKIIGKGFMQRSYRKGFERYNMGKGSARHREGIGKALETGIGRHREGIGKQSGKHPKASVRHREGTGKASESIGKASESIGKASGRHGIGKASGKTRTNKA